MLKKEKLLDSRIDYLNKMIRLKKLKNIFENPIVKD